MVFNIVKSNYIRKKFIKSINMKKAKSLFYLTNSNKTKENSVFCSYVRQIYVPRKNIRFIYTY